MTTRLDRGAIPVACLFALVGVMGASIAENIDPVGDDHQYAWGENVGWINAEPSGNGGPGVQVGDFKLTGWMWGENIGWISLSCENTATCGSNPYGVSNNGFGALFGFAWSENVGWIRFDPTTCAVDPTCKVRIDPVTGYFSGRAWGENIGWITFSAGGSTDWTARTNWCDAPLGPPGAGIALTVSPAGADLLLSWTAQAGDTWYDVVSGSLSSLRGSGGNFAVSTNECAVGKLLGTTHLLPNQMPAIDDGLWYLVRAANCRGVGTYDATPPSQVAPRDPGIAASSSACPRLAIEPSMLDFRGTNACVGGDADQVVVGTGGQTAEVTLRNTSAQPLTLSAIDVSNPQFSVGAPLPFVVPEFGGIIPLPLVFTPTSAGVFTETATVVRDTTPPVISLVGEGFPNDPPALAACDITPSTILLGQSTKVSVGVTDSATLANVVTCSASVSRIAGGTPRILVLPMVDDGSTVGDVACDGVFTKTQATGGLFARGTWEVTITCTDRQANVSTPLVCPVTLLVN